MVHTQFQKHKKILDNSEDSTDNVKLEKIDIPYVQVPGGSIFAYINGDSTGKTVLLRSDIDALPILESETNLKNKKVCISKNPGVMHGCGHDGHIAMLLSAAKILKNMEASLNGRVVLMFEEGEEGHRNIEKLLAYMAEKDMKFDTCYASHVRQDIPTGKLSCCQGSAMSGLYHFVLEINGKGGHGSRPDLAHSVIDCFHDIYSNLDTLRLKYIKPNTVLTWSLGSVNAGATFNLIPDKLTCEGSIRMMDRSSGEEFIKEFERIVAAICPLNYCTYQFKLLEQLLPTENYPACRKTYLDSIKKQIGEDVIYDCEPWMASETFSYMCSLFPGVETFVGIKNDELGSGANHHTPEFDLDEDGLTYGTAAAVSYVLEYFENTPDTSAFEPAYNSISELIATFGQQPGSTEYMDLMLNSNNFGIDGTAELLANIIRKNFGLQIFLERV